MKLSQALKQSMQKGQTIRLINNEITEIDELPELYATLKNLLLSENKISCLAGLVEFPLLEKLSLSSNQIDSFDELTYLEPLYNLRFLRIDGNPISYHPAYKCRILDILPDIEELDGERVTRNEKALLHNELQAIEEKEEIMLDELEQYQENTNQQFDSLKYLYQLVEKAREELPRTANWQSIYDKAAMQIENMLANSRSEIHSSVTNSGVKKRTASGSPNNENAHSNRSDEKSRSSTDTNALAENNSNVKTSLTFEDISPQNSVIETENNEMTRMRAQMDEMRAKIFEYEKANEENVNISIEEIHELEEQNEEFQQQIESLNKANTIYQQEYLQREEQLQKLEQQNNYLAIENKKSNALYAELEEKEKAAIVDCRNLAREVEEKEKLDKIGASFSKLRKSFAFQLLIQECKQEKTERIIEYEIVKKHCHNLKANCFAILTTEMRNDFRADLRYYESLRSKVPLMMSSWRKQLRRNGYLSINEREKLEKKAEFLVTQKNKSISKAAILIFEELIHNSESAEKYLAHKNEKLRNFLFCLMINKYRTLKRQELELAEENHKEILRLTFDEMGLAFQTLEARNILCQELERKNSQMVMYTAFLEFRIRNRQTTQVSSILRLKEIKLERQVFEEMKRTYEYVNSENAGAKLLSVNDHYEELHSQKCLMEKAFSTIRHKHNLLLEHATFLKRQKTTKMLMQILVLYERKLRVKLSITNSETEESSLESAKQELKEAESQNETLNKQISVLKEEIQKFYALFKESNNAVNEKKSEFVALELDNQRLNKLNERLNQQIIAYEQSEYSNENDRVIELDRLKIENAQIKAVLAQCEIENQSLKQNFSTINNNIAFNELFKQQEELQNSYNALYCKNAENESKIIELTSENSAFINQLNCKNSVIESENDTMRKTIEELKAELSESQEKQNMCENEREEIMSRIIKGNSTIEHSNDLTEELMEQFV